MADSTRKHRVVILGSGWGGIRLAQDLNLNVFDVTVVSPRDHFVMTPLLASAAVGTVDISCISQPVQRIRWSNEIHFVEASCESINMVGKEVDCVSTMSSNSSVHVPFDSLIIAVGGKSNVFGIPGVREHAVFLKEVSDANEIRKRISTCFKRASQENLTDDERKNLLHFAVIGGGPTGVEFIAELNDCLTEDMNKLYPHLQKFVSLALYTSGASILQSFSPKLVDFAMKHFQKNGIPVSFQSSVESVEESKFTLKGGRSIHYGMLVWCAGVAPVELVTRLTDGPHAIAANDKKSKRILTDEYLRVLAPDRMSPLEGVYALGDCADILGQGVPGTAQAANQKGVWLSKFLNRSVKRGVINLLDARASKFAHFQYSHRGSLAYVGKWRAILDANDPPEIPASPSLIKRLQKAPFYILPSFGILTFFIWRGFYLIITKGLKKQVQLLKSWVLNFVFGRDILDIQ
ncbi:hypothetical protein HDU80_009518 [Chytriomyces hyalinus]|nr:hypothetical protein HDU80_009518 [Chytriomyces hyalinus]